MSRPKSVCFNYCMAMVGFAFNPCSKTTKLLHPIGKRRFEFLMSTRLIAFAGSFIQMDSAMLIAANTFGSISVIGFDLARASIFNTFDFYFLSKIFTTCAALRGEFSAQFLSPESSNYLSATRSPASAKTNASHSSRPPLVLGANSSG